MRKVVPAIHPALPAVGGVKKSRRSASGQVGGQPVELDCQRSRSLKCARRRLSISYSAGKGRQRASGRVIEV